ncbi:MAG: hypothetical protein K8R23_05970 [Chthoniobacter sp.]|nr:hypothetical protein [Chthoniobacter sp.]
MPALFIVFVIGLLSGLLPETPIVTLATDVLNDLTLGLTTVFLTILFLNLDKVQRTGETTGETSVLNRRLGQHHGV